VGYEATARAEYRLSRLRKTIALRLCGEPLSVVVLLHHNDPTDHARMVTSAVFRAEQMKDTSFGRSKPPLTLQRRISFLTRLHRISGTGVIAQH